MDEELRLEISKIVSLAKDPELILPNLNPSQSSSKDINQPNTSQKRGNEDQAGPSTKQIRSKPLVIPTLSKKNRKYLGMKASELQFRIQGPKVVDFCQEHELVAKKVICSCGSIMQLWPEIVGNDYIWTCYEKKHTVRPQQTVRKGTWFEHAKLPVADILWISYMWIHEYSPASMLHECGNSNKILNDYCEYTLDMCGKIVQNKRNPIGGEGRSVEIFECKILRDKKPLERWAFCGIEQNSTNLLELLLDNKKPTALCQIFEKFFLPGTKVITHNWTPFKNLHQGDFLYFINDKSMIFFDVVTKKNMETFQDFKRATNRPPPGLNKWSKLEYGPSFFEKMYRKSLIFASDAYLTFLKDIALLYKPVERFVKSSSMKAGN